MPAKTPSSWGFPAAFASSSATLAPAFPLRQSAGSIWWRRNPPYVPTAVLASIPREVADFEPALALDGGRDGNDVLRRLLPWTSQALRPGGGFAFELHETCLDQAAELARQAGFTQVKITNDLSQRPRVLSGRKPV